MTNSETNFGDTHTNDDKEQNKTIFLEMNLLNENMVQFRKEIRQELSKTKMEPDELYKLSIRNLQYENK